MVTRIAGETALARSVTASRAGNSTGASRFDLEHGPLTTSTRSGAPKVRAITGLSRAISSVERQRDEIDRAIRSAMAGRTFSPTELLVLQSKVYTYSQDMEVISRMVDRVVSSVKTTLNTQV